jgi:hypothetical protein
MDQPKDAIDQLAEAQEQMMVLLERLVITLEAMSSSVIRQEGHIYLVAEQAHQTTGVAMEAGHLCAEHMLGSEELVQCWDSWKNQFKAEMSQMPWVIVVDSVEESTGNGARRDKGKGKE